MMASSRVDNHATFLRQAVELEGGKEHVKQTCVITVFYIFNIQFPVVGQCLCEAANDFNGFVKYALNACAYFWP